MQPVQETRPPLNGVAVASVGLGFFSMIVFWWYPFGLILATAGLVIGASCLAFKITGGRRGENWAMVGTVLCSISFGTIITLTKILHIMTWDPL
jgi:hypothetical protein